MRTLLLTLAVADTAPLRAALAASLGTSSIDTCQAVEAAVTWLENRPCDLLAIAGAGSAVAEAVGRMRRVSRTLPILAIVADVATPDAGACWLAGADDVTTAASLSTSQYPEGLDDARHPERHALRRTQRLWYAGPGDALRQQLVTRVGTRFRDVGLTGEGLAGLTTQDVEDTQSAALIVNAVQEPGSIVLGVRRVKRTYPELAVVVVAEGAHHEAFRRAGADECVPSPADADHLLQAVGRAIGQRRASFELDSVRGRETRLRALVEQLPEGVVLISPEHTVLAVNLAALRVLGAQDARQVLGASLSPWLDADDADAPDLVTLVDGMASGTTRELVMRTRHLAEARRLLLRAVPFQRESGGPPAALIVIREMPVGEEAPQAPVAAAPADDERQAWEQERSSLAHHVATLESELAALRPLEETLQATADALAEARAQVDELPQLRSVAARLTELGVDVDAIPSLIDGARRLASLEQEELPLLMARAEAVQQRQSRQDEEITSLRAQVARFEAAGAVEAAADDARPAAATPLTLADTHGWLLEMAGLGVVRTTAEGAVLEVNERAARLCGYADAGEMQAAASMPAPLLAAAGDDADGPVRFEVDLQVHGSPAPHRIAGARIAADGDDAIRTWLLAEAPALPGRAARHGNRQQAMSAVLEAAAAECRTVVETAGSRLRGPRPVDESGESAHSTGGQALARAQAMLAQLSAFGRRRSVAAAHDLAAHLEAAQPLLERLATEEVAWQLDLPAEPIHASVTAAEFERCVTAMVAIGRDALPVGGQLTLALGAGETSASAMGVRRPMAAVTVLAQGYGLVEPAVTPALRELADSLGASVDVECVDAFTARLTFELPRAFVMTHVA